MAQYKSFRPTVRFGETSSGRIPHERIKVGDEVFDSLAEKDRYLELLVMQKAGIISELQCHPAWELIPTQKVPGKRTFRGHRYTADFSYIRDGQVIVEDVKSERTREERDYIINRKLMWMLKGIYVEEVIR